MENIDIIELYWSRDEEAISQTNLKYGKLCRYITMNILGNSEDSEECVSDTYLSVWNSIPPQRPNRFSAFISRIARNLALKKFEYNTALKRNPEAVCSMSELSECISGKDIAETEFENRRIEQAISDFLWQQSEEKRIVFLRRYWYFDSISAICSQTGFSNNKVTSMLYRLRQELKTYLKKEGIEL